MKPRIKWNARALIQLDEAIAYIAESSPASADCVKKGILLGVDSLSKNPEKHKPDKYKTNNDGSFRAFEVYNYRISYRYNKADVRVVRIRHVKMNPLKY